MICLQRLTYDEKNSIEYYEKTYKINIIYRLIQDELYDFEED